MRQALADFMFTSPAWRSAVLYEQQEAAIARFALLRGKVLGGAATVQPPHPVTDEPLGGAVLASAFTPSEQMNHAKNSCAGRYTAVNLTNSDTVEIRMFRGTLKLNTLKATPCRWSIILSRWLFYVRQSGAGHELVRFP